LSSSPYLEALKKLRECSEALGENVSNDERARLLAGIEETLQLLEERPRRLSTRALVTRVSKLERELIDRPAGERAEIIQHRLGISRSRYYEIRKLAQSG
jgi:hypothetical protein